MPGEIPGIPQDEVSESANQSQRKADILAALEPISRAGPRQRFAQQDTVFDNPDRDPGVVRFRTEGGIIYDPSLIQEAADVENSRQYLRLLGKKNRLEERIGKRKKKLIKSANRGWRGTEFESLDGIGRALSAIPSTTAEITDLDSFMEGSGKKFANTVYRTFSFALRIPEGQRTGRGVISPELVRDAFKEALRKLRITDDQQQLLAKWGVSSTIYNLEGLRALIEQDKVPLNSIKVERSFSLRPDVLPSERVPKPSVEESSSEE